jgi:hypothetical protein
MLIAGVDVPPPAVAELVRRLEEAGHSGLAHRLRDASNRNRDRAGLFGNEEIVLLSVLEDPPELTQLRDALRSATGGQPPAGLQPRAT